MASTTLTNFASVSGLYGLLPATTSSLAITTEIITGLTVVKTADKEVWVDGPLMYTITVNNAADEAFTNVKITDLLDILAVTLDTDSIMIDGVATTDYTFIAGLLTVNLPDLAASGKAVVTFQVLQV